MLSSVELLKRTVTIKVAGAVVNLMKYLTKETTSKIEKKIRFAGASPHK